MIIFGVLFWLIVARVAVLLVEDLAAGVRGRRSPRRQARDKREAAKAKGRPVSVPPGEHVATALGRYVGDLIEDAAADARARRRLRRARRREKDPWCGLLVDLDDNKRWYTDCTECEWSSAPCRTEGAAWRAGMNHATQHGYSEKEEEEQEPPSRVEVDQPDVVADAGSEADVAGDEGLPAPLSRAQWQPVLLQGGADRSARESGDPEADQPGTARTARDRDQRKEEKAMQFREASGPEEIRAAMRAAIEAVMEKREELEAIEAVLTEGTERYEALGMAGSTIAHLRDAVQSWNAAVAALITAGEELEAALQDFDAKDGHVGDAVAETGGNLADAEILRH